MTVGFRRRSARRGAGGFAALVLVLGLLVGVEVAGRESPAVANPSGASPAVFVGGPGSNGDGPVDRLTLSSALAGGTAPAASPLGSPVAAIAINSTATKVVFGLQQPPPGTVPLPPAIAVEDVASGAVARRSTVGNPVAAVTSPTNSAFAYVLEVVSTGNGNSGRVDVVDVNNSPPTDNPLGTGGTGRILSPQTEAISPDGATTFVGGPLGGNPGLEAISISTGLMVPWSFTGHGGSIVDVAVSPDGSRLYGVSVFTNPANGLTDNEVFALPLPVSSFTEKVSWSHRLTAGTASPIQLATPTSVTVSPDGSAVYVGGNNNSGGGNTSPSAVQAFDASSGNPGPSTLVPIQTDAEGVGGVASIAVSPDGSALLVAGTDAATGASWVYPLSLPALSLGAGTSVGSEFGTLRGPEEVAMTPDQAPTASFSVIPGSTGSPTPFTAASSTVAYGSVSTFVWNFGDGHIATTATAAVAHTYTAPGNYNVTLTETDSAGTSIPPAVGGTGFAVDGPGQTPYRRADPSARTARVVGIPPAGVTPTTPPGGTPGTPGHPVLVLNPGLGPPGTLVTVTGSGFPANAAVTVNWSVSTGSVIIQSDGSGDLVPTVLPILVPDVLGPREAVASSSPPATAPFLVVPGSAEPGGERGSYLFRTEGP